jgi:hypothetical protein
MGCTRTGSTGEAGVRALPLAWESLQCIFLDRSVVSPWLHLSPQPHLPERR